MRRAFVVLSDPAEAKGGLLTAFLPPTQDPQRKKRKRYGQKRVNGRRHLILTTLES
jgi:hypothetical protein